jgi:IS6 family transposase
VVPALRAVSPLLADAARFCRHQVGDRCYIDETYVKVAGLWRYVYRAIDQHGQVIDVLVSTKRDKAAARRYFRHALADTKVTPVEVVTDAAGTYHGVLDELTPSAWHHVEQYANNPTESDHSRLKQRLRPMRGLGTDRTATVIIAGHTFMQNVRRGHYELGVEAPARLWVAAAFDEPADAIRPNCRPRVTRQSIQQRNGPRRRWRLRPATRRLDLPPAQGRRSRSRLRSPARGSGFHASGR